MGKESNNRRVVVRHKENPFLGSTAAVIKTKKSYVTVGTSNTVLLDQETGEVAATNVVAVREVDEAMFVKLFTQNMGLMMGLKAQGIKALAFLMWSAQHYALRKDVVQLDNFTREDFVQSSRLIFSDRTMYAGLNQLEDCKIIAKAQKPGFFFINPHFVFNGDRIRFMTEIRRKRRNIQDEMEAAGQQRLID